MQRLKRTAPPGLAASGDAREHRQALDRQYTTTPPVETLLSRLDRVRETGPGRWRACCPAHEGRSQSLAIRETGDGTTLLHCFAGCPIVEVLARVGLELRDLFPAGLADRRPLRPGERWIPKDVLACCAHEALTVLCAAETLRAGHPLGQEGIDRLALAAGRLRAAAREVGCHV